MKTVLFAFLVTAALAPSAFAAQYVCNVLNISAGGPRVLGEMRLDSEVPGTQEVQINEEHDRAICGMSKPSTPNDPQLVMCAYAAKSESIRFRKIRLKRSAAIIAYAKNRFTGALTTEPVAYAEVGARTLGLALPQDQSIYLSQCSLK